MQNPKASKLDVDLNTMAPVTPANIVKVIKGTEPGHYYNVVFENSQFMIGFRHLNEDYSPVLRRGATTRIRVVPLINEELSAKLMGVFSYFGFEKRSSTPGIHYSVVVSNPCDVIDALIAVFSA